MPRMHTDCKIAVPYRRQEAYLAFTPVRDTHAKSVITSVDDIINAKHLGSLWNLLSVVHQSCRVYAIKGKIRSIQSPTLHQRPGLSALGILEGSQRNGPVTQPVRAIRRTKDLGVSKHLGAPIWGLLQ